MDQHDLPTQDEQLKRIDEAEVRMNAVARMWLEDKVVKRVLDGSGQVMPESRKAS